MRQNERIIKALLARGERELSIPNVYKWRVFTRTVHRNLNGELQPVVIPGYHWYVSKTGHALRMGISSIQSISVPLVRARLLEEYRP
jgi:hypothetical protein